MNEIQTDLRSFRRRVKVLRAWRGLAIGGTVGATAAALWALLDYLRLFYTEWLWLGLLVAAAGIVGAVAGIFRPISDRALAESIDRRARLDERLSTAIDSPESTFAAVIQEDATTHLKKLRPKRLYPVRLSRWHGALLAVSILAACLFLLGNSPLLMSDQQKQDRKEMNDAADAVERVAKPLLDENDKGPQEKALSQQLEKYRDELKRGRMSKQEALQKADELSQEAEKLSKDRFEQSEQELQTAQAALDNFAKTQLQKNGFGDIDPSMLKSSPDENARQANALNEALSKLQQQLQSGKNEKGQNLSEAEKAALKAQMEALQKQLQQIQLSQKAQEFLQRLYSQPEWKKLMEMMRQAQKLAKTGKAGQPSLTAEQVKQMIKELEKLADRMKSDKDMQDFIKKLEESLKSGCFG